MQTIGNRELSDDNFLAEPKSFWGNFSKSSCWDEVPLIGLKTRNL